MAMEGEQGPRGVQLLPLCFTEAALAELEPAMQVLQQSAPSRVTETLCSVLRLGAWQEARTALSGLRAQGRAALWTLPVVFAWLRLNAPRAKDAFHHYGLNEAGYALAEWARHLRLVATDTAEEQARQRMRRFWAEECQAVLLEVLALPEHPGHRGMVHALREGPGPGEPALRGLRQLLERPPPGHDDWYRYARAEALAALCHLETLATQRAPEPSIQPMQSAQATEREHEAEAVPEAAAERREEALTRLWAMAARDPDPSVRGAALEALSHCALAHGQLWELALRAAQSEAPAERRAAVLVLARFAR